MSWRRLLARSKRRHTWLTSITPDGFAAEHVLGSLDEPWLTALQLRQQGHRRVRLHQRVPLGSRASVEAVELVEPDPARVPDLRRDWRGRYAVGSISFHVGRRLLWRTVWHPPGYRPHPRDETGPLPAWLEQGGREVTPLSTLPAWPLLESLARAKAAAEERRVPFNGPVLLTRAQCESLHLMSGRPLPDDWNEQVAAGLQGWTVLGYPAQLVHADDESTPWAHGWRPA